MPFLFVNLILLLLGLFTYFHFRSGVSAFFRISKMRKRYIRMNQKGFLNYWLYSHLHKQHNLGILYYLNISYLITLILFSVAFVFSWISIFKILIVIIGVLLGLVSVPVFLISLIYINIEEHGKPFIVFKVFKRNNSRRWNFATIFDLLYCVFPLGLYIFLLYKCV